VVLSEVITIASPIKYDGVHRPMEARSAPIDCPMTLFTS
jgi:hypothetical protein